MAGPRRIDVHHHVTPPSYIEAASQITYGNAPRMSWSLAKSLEDMDQGGVATAIISLPHPVTIWPQPKDAQRALARDWNEFVAKLARDHPGRFGLFASLPILDIEGSLLEIEHAFGALQADGINLITNIGDKWLGDPYYDPIFDELNRRKAVIYTHPLAPNCLHDCLPGVNDSVVEFGSDTTRAIARILFGGAATRFPDIKWIFSHAGGTMPFLVERFERAPGRWAPAVEGGSLYHLKRFHYDTAQAAHSWALMGLTRLVASSQILFGTDFPYRTATETAQGIVDFGFSASDLALIDRGNAARLLPRWRG
ncbi:MAG TPA: amidohydrolase family protein [Stellaceae bacterium]|jgi:predicted TIM-barrel fold metal-dependent hydrolase